MKQHTQRTTVTLTRDEYGWRTTATGPGATVVLHHDTRDDATCYARQVAR